MLDLPPPDLRGLCRVVAGEDPHLGISIPGMTTQTDVLARALAVLGLMTSVASLGWQLINHRLTGARVRCELRLAVHDDGNPAGTIDTMADRSLTDLKFLLEDVDRNDFPHEAALITVRNCGRTPVSVHYPGLDCGDFRGGVGTTPRGFEMPTGFCKLEPGEAKQWLTPLWPSLKQYRDAHPGPRSLCGQQCS